MTQSISKAIRAVANAESNKIYLLCNLINNNKTIEALELTKTIENSKLKVVPLHIAIKNENITVMLALLDSGVSPNWKNGNGRDAFHYAKETDNPQLMGVLNRYDTSSFFRACLCWCDPI